MPIIKNVITFTPTLKVGFNSSRVESVLDRHSERLTYADIEQGRNLLSVLSAMLGAFSYGAYGSIWFEIDITGTNDTLEEIEEGCQAIFDKWARKYNFYRLAGWKE